MQRCSSEARSQGSQRLARPGGGVHDGAGDASFLGSRVEVRDGIAGFAGKLHAAHGHEADGEAVHAVADVGARAIGAEDVAGEVLLLVREPPPSPEG